jgi:ABC-type Mn2+/Zn2+ transport system permease subunit
MDPAHARAIWQTHFCVLLWGLTAILGKLITLPALPLVWWRMLIVVAALALPFYNRLMLASFNPQLAAVRGVAVKALDYLFVVLVTIVTVAAVKVIGAILVGALLVIPAATARLLSHSLKGFFRVSVGVATLATLAGILLPIQFDLPVPSGAAIILSAETLFAALFGFLLMGDRLSTTGMVGCALIFICIVAVQMMPMLASGRVERA